jgi:deoxyribodipyrimidine photo-lyase
MAHWFTHDLRLHDQPAWAHHPPALAVFVFQPQWLLTNSLGLAPMGSHRLTLLNQSLVDLRQSLRQRGGDLHLLWGQPAAVLPQWAAQHGVASLTASDATTPFERADLAAVANTVAVVRSWNHTLLHPNDLPEGPLPDVFTTFRKRVENPLTVRPTVEAHGQWTPTTVDEEPWERLQQWAETGTPPLQGGETAGLERLHAFVHVHKALGTYKETRNGMLHPWHSSRLSPYLAWGSLSPRRIYEEVRLYETRLGANESTYWLIFELLWRDYFHFSALARGATLFQWQGWNGQATQQPALDAALFEQWRTGQTGNPLVDACMRELLHTGWMSNRGRQNAASFWINDLGQPWLIGAQWFEQQLIDFDPASNYGNWQYLAGVGHDPRPNRWFNTQAQAERYDPDGSYRATWLK